MSTRFWKYHFAVGAATGLTLSMAVAMAAPWSRTRSGCACGIPARDYRYGERSPAVIVVSQRAFPVMAPTPMLLQRLEFGGAAFRVTPTSPPRPLPTAPLEATPSAPPGIVGGAIEELPPPPGAVPIVDMRRVGGPIVDIPPPSGLAPGPGPPEAIRAKLFQWDRPQYAIGQCSISRPAFEVFADGTWTLSLRADQNPLPPDPALAGFNPTAHIRRNLFVVKLRCFMTAGAAEGAAVDAVGHPEVVEIPPIEFWVENAEPLTVRRSGHWHCPGLSDADAFMFMDRAELEFYFR